MPPPAVATAAAVPQEDPLRSALGLAGDTSSRELAAALRRAASEIEERAGVSQSASAAKCEEAGAAATVAVTTTATPEPPRPLRRQTRRERRASTDSAWERRRASSSVCAILASEFPLRPVALEVFYLGWAFRGFTTQTSVSSDLSSSSSAAAPSRQRGSEAYGDDGTVEAQLFRALRRTGLVPCLVQPGGEEGSEGNEKKNGRRGRGGGGNGGDGSGGGDFEEALPPSSSAEAPSTWKDLGYARCGRTDAGVSGMGQVVSLRLRSKLRRFQKVKKKSKEKERSGDDGDDDDDDGDDHDGLFASSSPPSSSEEDDKQDESDSEEIDYPSLLNKALPAEVRVTGWAPLRDDGSFSARFSATAREYRYFFVDDSNLSGAGGGLDLAAMREAASALVGLRDFRNVCKPDLPAVTNFVRRVYSCEVEEWTGALDDPFPSGEATPSPPAGGGLLGSSPSAARFRGAVLRIRGAAFLLHQVRCVASLLLMVGRGQERASVVSKLLDVSATPRKPHYDLAAPEPLLFSGCDFGHRLAWRRSERALDQARLSVRELLRARVAGVALLGAAAARLDELARETSAEAKAEREKPSSSSPPPPSLFPQPPLPAAITRRHVPLFKRGSDPPLEERAAAKGFVLTTGAAPKRPAKFSSPSLAEA